MLDVIRPGGVKVLNRSVEVKIIKYMHVPTHLATHTCFIIITLFIYLLLLSLLLINY